MYNDSIDLCIVKRTSQILLYLAQCQHHNTTLPIRIPSIALSNSSTCPLLNTIAQRELVRKTLQRYYSSDDPPCPVEVLEAGLEQCT